ncbi:MAG: hypothetical protein NZ484_00880 [Patescibacteria group bacterium]|nr:hypothetical protein [Patescibacteria group bacterium]MCX7589532.1 hypothetical protein [Patescibacteria group bacterium]MDW8279739.1 hypothetical protein [bacterium]
MLETRKRDILFALINEFIKKGEPISSYDLYNSYDFGIKPAMIRNELLELGKLGYLNQPHYSSGRVPTDLAYELFVESILNSNLDLKIDKFLIDGFEKMEWRFLAERLSKILGVLSFITNIPEEEFVYKEGLEYLIDKSDWQTKDEIKEIVHDFENLEDNLAKQDQILEEENFIKVFVGKRNPLTKSDSLSIIMADYDVKQERILLLTMGPKRMNYKKAFCIFKGLKKYFYYNG